MYAKQAGEAYRESRCDYSAQRVPQVTWHPFHEPYLLDWPLQQRPPSQMAPQRRSGVWQELLTQQPLAVM